jgi:hypothetical protein
MEGVRVREESRRRGGGEEEERRRKGGRWNAHKQTKTPTNAHTIRHTTRYATHNTPPRTHTTHTHTHTAVPHGWLHYSQRTGFHVFIPGLIGNLEHTHRGEARCDLVLGLQEVRRGGAQGGIGLRKPIEGDRFHVPHGHRIERTFWKWFWCTVLKAASSSAGVCSTAGREMMPGGGSDLCRGRDLRREGRQARGSECTSPTCVGHSISLHLTKEGGGWCV